MIAVNCGAPAPVTTRVVQIDPGPTPTFTASAPASASALAPAAVATFPAISGRFLKTFFTAFTASITPFECPWALSRVITSTPAFFNASTRSRISEVMPIAAPATRRPILSLQEFGALLSCMVSRKVISPMSFPFLSTIGSFSILYCSSMRSAFCISVPAAAVTSRSLVITSLTFFFMFLSKRRSRLVSMPTSILLLSTIGIPPILLSFIIFSASPTVASGFNVMGSRIRPFSERFTLRTCSDWRSILMFLCRIPMPPSRDSAIASGASVTVSIAAETMGMFIRMSFVRLVTILTSRGSTSE